MELCVATANIAGWLSRDDAADSLTTVLRAAPDLVALQEWGPGRRALLRLHAELGWRSPWVGGCAVGWRRDRFGDVRGRALVLSTPGFGVRTRRRPEPGRVATVVRATDRMTGREICLISFHLVYGVQAAGRYREDLPRLVARHRSEVDRLRAAVTRLQARGVQVVAAGDSNFHGLALPPLVSAWDRPSGESASAAGTLGPRLVDDVFAGSAPDDVRLVPTRSDHRAVLARWRRAAS